MQNAIGKLDVARKARARSLRCKAHMDSAEVEVAEDTNGAAAHRDDSEERLLRTKQSGDIRLKSVRGADFAGASICSQVWEWRYRWNIHYESAGTILHHCIHISMLYLSIFSSILPTEGRVRDVEAKPWWL